MIEQNLDVLRAWISAFERGDIGSAARLFPGGSVLHATHPPDIAGDYVGLEQVLQWYRKKRALAGEGFGWEVHDILASDHHGVILFLLHSGKGTGRAEWKQVAVYHMSGGAIREVWLHEESPSFEYEVVSLEHTLQQAVAGQDRATLEALLADDFVLTGSERLGLLSREQWIGAATSRFRLAAYEFAGLTVIERDVAGSIPAGGTTVMSRDIVPTCLGTSFHVQARP